MPRKKTPPVIIHVGKGRVHEDLNDALNSIPDDAEGDYQIIIESRKKGGPPSIVDIKYPKARKSK